MRGKPTSPVSEWALLVGIAALIILGVLFVFVVSKATNEPVALATQSTVPLSTATVQSTPYLITTPNLPTDYPPAKKTFEFAIYQTRQAAVLTSPPGSTNTPGPSPSRPPTYTPQPIETGIFADGDIPLPVAEFTISGGWQDIVDHQLIRIYAGAKRDHPGETMDASTGVLVAFIDSLEGPAYTIETYEAPISNTGVLTITAVTSEYRLTLQAQSGAVLFFDVPTREFVDSLIATITAPTATRLPTYTPTLSPPASSLPPTAYPLPTPVASTTTVP